MIAIGGEWQLQTAKNKFSELVNKALTGDAQLVKRRGEPVVYVISAKAFDRMNKPAGESLKKLLLNSPCKDIELAYDRSCNDTGRKVEL
ncbi:MAG: type II toxin-antitoxin system Phd/YefM family antitoxin [Candidatus Lindowbacteria bacterium]|nr:type II toxin-antitoxin system Phd/YefM family antitoxin [Candidatus Lindowbacteria bacterium]